MLIPPTHVVSTGSRERGGGGRGQLALADVGRPQVLPRAAGHGVHGVPGSQGREASGDARGVPGCPAGLPPLGQGKSALRGVSTWLSNWPTTSWAR